uniref:PH domain-containing protein n=1 Tax=Rodentolepis nana TaxID=102285 RepID=A0A0R3TSH1_RODNA
LMLNSVFLGISSSDIFIDDLDTPFSHETVALQKRRKALRQRLLLRSQQLLADSSSQNSPLVERLEIDIKSQGLAFGKIHSSLVGGRENCFFIKMPTGTTRIFASASHDERKCWLTRSKFARRPMEWEVVEEIIPPSESNGDFLPLWIISFYFTVICARLQLSTSECFF